MKIHGSISLIILFSVFLSGCVTTPKVSEMSQLKRGEVVDLLAGKTAVERAHWGQWIQYYEDDTLRSSGRASGDKGWVEDATAVATLSDDGELCHSFTGNHEWTPPDNKYCAKLYIDQKGDYYSEVTQDKQKPEKIGRLRKVTLYTGNKYNLP